MTLLALKEARALGVRVSILHASPLGRSVYSRLGFKEYCRLDIYVLGLTTDEASGLAFLGRTPNQDGDGDGDGD